MQQIRVAPLEKEGIEDGAIWIDHFPGNVVVKNMPARLGDTADSSLIPGSGRSTGEGNGNPFQYSCLENSIDRGTW